MLHSGVKPWMLNGSHTNETVPGHYFHEEPLTNHWVQMFFFKKRDQNGLVVLFKARLVAKGFKQKYGVDFFETCSPVANIYSIRVVLSVCAA